MLKLQVLLDFLLHTCKHLTKALIPTTTRSHSRQYNEIKGLQIKYADRQAHKNPPCIAWTTSLTTPTDTTHTSRALPAPPHQLPLILRVRCQPCRPQIPRVIRVRCQHHCLPDPSRALPAPPRCCCRCGTIGTGRAAGYPARHVTP